MNIIQWLDENLIKLLVLIIGYFIAMKIKKFDDNQTKLFDRQENLFIIIASIASRCKERHGAIPEIDELLKRKGKS